MGNIIKAVLAGLLLLGIGVGIGRYLTPPKIQEKIVEKEVVKEKKNVKEITHIVEHPDGTKETIIDRTDKSSTTTDTSVTIDKKTSNLPDWKISAGVGLDTRNKEQYYVFGVDRRILANISVGIFGTTNKQAGVMVGIEF